MNIPHSFVSHFISNLLSVLWLCFLVTKKKESMKRKLAQTPPPYLPATSSTVIWPMIVDEMSVQLMPTPLGIPIVSSFTYPRILHNLFSLLNASHQPIDKCSPESRSLPSYRLICLLLYSKSPQKSCLCLVCLILLRPVHLWNDSTQPLLWRASYNYIIKFINTILLNSVISFQPSYRLTHLYNFT